METNRLNPKQFFNRLGLAYFAGSVILVGMQYLMIFLMGVIAPQYADNVNVSLLVSYLPLVVIVYPLLMLIVTKMVPKAPAIEKKKLGVGQFILYLIMTYSLLYVGNILGNAVNAITKGMAGQENSNPVVDLVINLNLPLTILFVVIAAPIFEEIVFRKFLIDRVIQYGEGCAVVISGVFFMLLHGNFSQGFYALFIGLMLGFLYVRTGQIRYTIILHMIVNAMGSVIAPAIMKLVDFQEVTRLVTAGDMEAYMQYVMDNMTGFAIYGCYVVTIFIISVIGWILLIVLRKKFKLSEINTPIAKGERFKTVFLNPGMLLYCLLWIIMYILSVFNM